MLKVYIFPEGVNILIFYCVCTSNSKPLINSTTPGYTVCNKRRRRAGSFYRLGYTSQTGLLSDSSLINPENVQRFNAEIGTPNLATNVMATATVVTWSSRGGKDGPPKTVRSMSSSNPQAATVMHGQRPMS